MHRGFSFDGAGAEGAATVVHRILEAIALRVHEGSDFVRKLLQWPQA